MAKQLLTALQVAKRLGRSQRPSEKNSKDRFAVSSLTTDRSMSKQLLSAKDVANRLNISRAKFYVLRPKLVAKGLKGTRVGKNMKYLESSLEELIDTAIRTGQPLV